MSMYVENKKNNLQGIWMLQEEVRGKYKDEDVEERRLLHLPLPWYTHHSKIFFSRLLIILAFPKLPFYLRLSVSLVWNDNDGNLKVEEFRFWCSNPHYCDVFVKKGLEWSLFLCSLMSGFPQKIKLRSSECLTLDPGNGLTDGPIWQWPH